MYNKTFTCVLFALLTLMSCSDTRQIDLSRDWKILITRYPENVNRAERYPLPEFDDSTWQKLDSLPAALSMERKKSIIWLRKNVVIPEKYRGRDLGIFIGRVWDQATTYLNGSRIGTTGREYPDFHSDWNAAAWHFMPGSLIRYGEKNVITIRQFTNQQANFNSAPFIGYAFDVRNHHFYEKFLGEHLSMSFGILCLLIGVSAFIAFLAGKRENRLLGHFSGMSILWFILTTHFWAPTFGPLPWNMQDQIFYILSGIMVSWIYFFLEMALEVKLKAGRIAIVILFLLITLLAVTASTENPITGWRFDIIGLIGFTAEIFWGVILFLAHRKGNREAKIIFFGYIFFIGAIFHDALMMNRIFMSKIFMVNIGYPALLGSFGVLMGQRVMKLARDLSESTKEIEEKNRNLNAVFQSVMESTDELIMIATKVNDTTETLSSGMDRQKKSLEETTHEVETISGSIETVAANALQQDEAVHGSDDLLNSYSDSLSRITSAAESMVTLGDKSKQVTESITGRLDHVQEGMLKLKNSSTSIEEIATMINDVAEQTNLLSLNAAIEAARAGDHGRGFAVVADEIGKLADNSVQQAKTIQNIVKEIVQDIEGESDLILKSGSALESINSSVADVNEASRDILQRCMEQEKMMANLHNHMKGIMEGSREITVSTGQQKGAIVNVVNTVNLLDEIAGNIEKSTEQMVEISKSLSHRIAILNKIIIEH